MLHTLFFILLLEGFVTISVEILTIRQLLPFFGGSVLITSVIIGVFLLFLALGYWQGGRCQTNIFQRLNRNFSLALVWIGLGLTYSFIACYFYMSMVMLQLTFLLSLSVYLFLFLAPTVYWLGQTIPLTTNLFNQTMRVSDINGRALFISTMGSFLGAILTSLVLFQYLGVAWTVVINCGLLFLLILYLRPDSECSWSFIGGMFLVLIFIKMVNLDIEARQFIKTNNYANYEVAESPLMDRMLKINHSNSSLLTSDKKGFAYIEFMRDLLFNKLHLQNKQILVIGAGGFTLTANGTNQNDVTYVDIDPEIKKIAENHFLHAPIQGHFVGQDARAYLNQSQDQFDVIISDAYSNQSTIPAALLTTDYFQAIAHHLKPSGLLMINIIDAPLFNDAYTQTASNTIRAVFPYCNVMPVNWQAESALVNTIYICPNITKNKAIYRDNLTSVTLDFFNRTSS
jgi:spermidine synthase